VDILSLGPPFNEWVSGRPSSATHPEVRLGSSAQRARVSVEDKLASVPLVERVEVSDALTFWTAPHPAWSPNRDWPEDVGFATWEAADAYAFIDPLLRDDRDPSVWERFDAAVSSSQRDVVVLLTAPWHERSVRAVSNRYQAPVWIHERGRPRIKDLPQLMHLPSGVEVFAPDGVNEGQVAFYIAPERALVVAEFFLGTQDGLRVLPVSGHARPPRVCGLA